MRKIHNKILHFISASTAVFTLATPAFASVTLPGGSVPSLGSTPTASEFSGFFQGLKTVGVAVSGICTITALIFFIISLTKISASAGNDQMRSRAIKGVLWSGISLALFGGITIVVSIFWNFI